MSKKITYLAAFALVALLIVSACTKAGTGFNTYDLEYNQLITIDNNNRIRFTEVIEDSRCPIDVECVWAGRAVIGFEWTQGTETSIHFSLALGPDNPEAADTTILDLYKVELLQVLPQPLSTEDPQPEDYDVRILVEEL